MARRRSRYVYVQDRSTHPVRRFFVALLLLLWVALVAVGVYNLAKSNEVTLQRQKVTVSNLPADLESWSILHLSDLHGATLGAGQSGLRRAIGHVNVSCVVMTGDMLGPNGDVEPLMQVVDMLPADKPKMLVLGDEDPDYLDPRAHGNLTAKADWAARLEEKGVIILDEPMLFTRGARDYARIWFIPADLYDLDLDNLESIYRQKLERLNAKGSLTPDESAERRVAEYQIRRAQSVREKIREIRADDIQIVVSHAPVSSQEMAEAVQSHGKNEIFTLRQASLILAGHYCGGQVRLPGKGAVYVPDVGWWPNDAQIAGLQYMGGVPQYISRGLGASKRYPLLHFRVLNPPQATYIELTTRINGY